MRVVRICLFILGAERWFDASDTKASVIAKLGQPIDTGGTSRRHRAPQILVYDPHERVEFHFAGERLVLVYQERDGVPVLCVPFTSASNAD